MSKKYNHNWKVAKPHHVTTGKITTKKFALKHPNKVEWVKDKK